MCKISRTEAFFEVTKAIDSGNIKKAKKIFKIIVKSIAKDRENNTFSEYIKLKDIRQIKLFENILIKDDE